VILGEKEISLKKGIRVYFRAFVENEENCLHIAVGQAVKKKKNFDICTFNIILTHLTNCTSTYTP
jgi:hypothetical protein